MRAILAGALFLALAVSALGVDESDLDFRIRKLAFKFETMQAKADKRVPPRALREARGVILLDLTKAGFGFGYQGGGGIAMIKDPKTGEWSPPVFLKSSEASLGFQVGGQQCFVVILLMNTNATPILTQSTIKVGGQAGGTAGHSSGSVEVSFTSTEPLVRVYSDSEGLYGGVSFKGGALSPDTDDDVAYYGQYLSAGEILFGHRVKQTEPAQELARKLDQHSK